MELILNKNSSFLSAAGERMQRELETYDKFNATGSDGTLSEDCLQENTEDSQLMSTLPTLTLTTDHFHELVREAYKQGYQNARYDAEQCDIWNDSESDLDDWLAEAIAEGSIGDIQIRIEE